MELGPPRKGERRLQAIIPLLLILGVILAIAGIAAAGTGWPGLAIAGTGILLIVTCVRTIPRHLERSGGEARLRAAAARKHASHAEAMATMFREVADRFDHASVEVWEDMGETRIRLSCTEPETAEFGVFVMSDEVDAEFGDSGHTGEMFDSRSSSEDWVNRYRPLVEAVVEGRFRQTSWRKDGLDTGKESVFTDPAGKVIQRFGYGQHGNRKAERADVVYAPYS